MNEFELLAKIIPTLPSNAQVVRGAGDDCAVLDFGLQHELILFKTDAVVEDVHFTKEIPPEKSDAKRWRARSATLPRRVASRVHAW